MWPTIRRYFSIDKSDQSPKCSVQSIPTSEWNQYDTTIHARETEIIPLENHGYQSVSFSELNRDFKYSTKLHQNVMFLLSFKDFKHHIPC